MAWQFGRRSLLAFVATLPLLGALAATRSSAQVAAPSSPATTTVVTDPLRVDGPYVWTRGDDVDVLWIAPIGNDERLGLVRETLSKKDLAAKRFTCVVDDAARTSFPVAVRAEHPILPAVWPQPERLLVTSDIEGNFDALVRMLRSQGVVDDSLSWSYGTNHVLVLGDSVDRGDNVTQVLWLLYKLDGEARASGGALHMVLGNHETMLMRGDDRYIAPKYRRLLSETKRPIDDFFSAESELGRWLRSKHALVKIGDDLFVHAGIGPAFLSKKLSIDDANSLVRKNLGLKRLDADGVLAIGNDGPLWYRGLVVATEIAPKADAAHVERVIDHYGVRRVIVGHTLVDRMSTDYDGRVLRIDLLHPKTKADGVARALLIEKGASFVVGDDGSKTAVE